MPDRGLGNEVQARAMADQVADAAVAKFAQMYGQPAEARPEIPATMKWIAGVAAALLTVAITGATTWGVTTLNALQITVARMDERQQRDVTPARLDKIDERVTRLEQAKQETK